jgi:dipeptidase
MVCMCGRAGGAGVQMVDATGEAWIFHISADPTHQSAYWAAQRVPDGHIA